MATRLINSFHPEKTSFKTGRDALRVRQKDIGNGDASMVVPVSDIAGRLQTSNKWMVSASGGPLFPISRDPNGIRAGGAHRTSKAMTALLRMRITRKGEGPRVRWLLQLGFSPRASPVRFRSWVPSPYRLVVKTSGSQPGERSSILRRGT